jgi:hypothetical protein
MIRKDSSKYKDLRKFQMIGKIDPEPFENTQEGSITFLNPGTIQEGFKLFKIVREMR